MRTYKPDAFLIENPATGMLAERPFMKGIRKTLTSFCMYNFPYQKKTYIWFGGLPELRLKDCEHGFDPHQRTLGRAFYLGTPEETRRTYSYRIPYQLLHRCAEQVEAVLYRTLQISRSAAIGDVQQQQPSSQNDLGPTEEQPRDEEEQPGCETKQPTDSRNLTKNHKGEEKESSGSETEGISVVERSMIHDAATTCPTFALSVSRDL